MRTQKVENVSVVAVHWWLMCSTVTKGNGRTLPFTLITRLQSIARRERRRRKTHNSIHTVAGSSGSGVELAPQFLYVCVCVCACVVKEDTHVTMSRMWMWTCLSIGFHNSNFVIRYFLWNASNKGLRRFTSRAESGTKMSCYTLLPGIACYIPQ